MLTVNNLSVKFSSYSFGLRRRVVQVIRSLDLSLSSGKILAVVGQSGAGKSLLAHALIGILPGNAEVSGELLFKGKAITPDSIEKLRGREIALIPQSVAYLNPLLRVGTQIARAAQLSGCNGRPSRHTIEQCLLRYHLQPAVTRWFPFQLSGGMARRVLVATATIGMADLLLADEPTNGLDTQAAAEALNHLRQLADTGKAVLLITHDIQAALEVADEVAVFCGGVTVEVASARAFGTPGGLRHPYSQALWNALPTNLFMEAPTGASATGDLLDVESWPCPFHSHCPRQDADCLGSMAPPLRKDGEAGWVRCHHA